MDYNNEFIGLLLPQSMVKQHNKLVRDGIPEIIRRDGRIPYTHIVQGSDLEGALMLKLDEECAEFAESRDPMELADILEVVYAIADFYNVDRVRLEEMRKAKAEERGCFARGIMLDQVR